MQFRTEIMLPASAYPVTHTQKVVLLGSCFAQNIGQLLQEYKFNVAVNPCGILYNPLSVAQTLQLLAENARFTQNDLFFYREQWLSFAHHGSFSHTDANQCLLKINHALANGTTTLQQAQYLIITLGTAYVYHLKSNGQPVANCHKLPDALFTRSRLGVPDVVAALKPVLSRLLQTNTQLRVILTVSPVRHWKDGATNNQLSKAMLIVAAHELVQLFNNRIDYFPAYELVMDDLRDYRFYQPDMLHPTPAAIEYVWQKFSDVYFSAQTHALMHRIKKITDACKHIPFNPHTQAGRNFAQQQLLAIEQLQQQHTCLNFTEEINSLKTRYGLQPPA